MRRFVCLPRLCPQVLTYLLLVWSWSRWLAAAGVKPQAQRSQQREHNQAAPSQTPTIRNPHSFSSLTTVPSQILKVSRFELCLSCFLPFFPDGHSALCSGHYLFLDFGLFVYVCDPSSTGVHSQSYSTTKFRSVYWSNAGFETFGYVGLGRARYVRLLLPFEQFWVLLSASTVQAILNNKHPLPRCFINFTVDLKCSLRVRSQLSIPHRHTCGMYKTKLWRVFRPNHWGKKQVTEVMLYQQHSFQTAVAEQWNSGKFLS